MTTGELAPVYDTPQSPGECCTSHAATAANQSARPARPVYKRDARQLVRAGLAGGKGIPETIVMHPCVFATLTAPSFGPVHARRMRGKTVLPCRPRRDASSRRCPHGRDISCPVRHIDEDPRLGQPMCPDCYDYTAAVLFNAHAGDLWRRFTTYLPRYLARLVGVSGKQMRAELRTRYVKVAEYQARGVVHFHAVIRLDASGEGYQPPARPLHRRHALRRHRPGRRRRPHHRRHWHRPAAVTSSGSAHRPTPGPFTATRSAHTGQPLERPGRSQLHRQVRHQDPHRTWPDLTPASAPPSTSPDCAVPATTGR